MRIEACFDSHVHWAATGEFHHRLRLDSLTAPADILQLQPDAGHYRGDWLLGFGWDENKWSAEPDIKVLDRWAPANPVALSRCDGHALWVNSEALRRAGLQSATGVLNDREADKVRDMIPASQPIEIRRHMLQATRIFNTAGYTHIRDMTCDEAQWQEAVKLDQSGLLTLAVEEFFWLKAPRDLDRVLLTALKAKESATQNLRVKGLKVFLDGALGSEGAWLSRCYHHSQHAGEKLWEDDALREVLIKAWEKGLEVAVHAIGDEAVDLIVKMAASLKHDGHSGRLHIEHGELIRPETILRMKSLEVECHLQPSHWLSDQAWLKEKVGPLFEHAFPWRRLHEAEIPFDFGSDSPIEPPSIPRIFSAIRSSIEGGIPRLLGSPASYMSHRDLSWAANSFTLLEDENPVQVVFRGEHL